MAGLHQWIRSMMRLFAGRKTVPRGIVEPEAQADRHDEEEPWLDNSPLDNELLESVWEGDLEHVNQLLRLGANVECVNECKNTPLHLGVEQLDLNMARLLLEAGARVDGRTADGYWTPLSHAIDSVSDAASQLDVPPDNSLVRLLIERGANVNTVTSRGESLLDQLTHYLNREAEEILIAAGANVRMPEGRS